MPRRVRDNHLFHSLPVLRIVIPPKCLLLSHAHTTLQVFTTEAAYYPGDRDQDWPSPERMVQLKSVSSYVSRYTGTTSSFIN